MNYDTWKAISPGTAQVVEEMNPGLSGDDPASIFAALCDYGRSKYLYVADEIGGPSTGMLSCRSASNLVLGVMLKRLGGDVDATTVDVFGEGTPIVTPPVTNPGVKIANNLRGGANRMLFNGGHSITIVQGVQYDIIGGMSGSIDFLPAAQAGVDDKGHPKYQCDVDGATRTFFYIGGATGNGVTEYRVDPPIG